ncbi:hypothetical protein ACFFIS_05645 [Virgibacillus soli]|uniref:Integral inner membrane protein n=1 Tax=Paracerasibacillus soli TaxID=480284 RepID=A0ABU5CW86_9BACI|nr:hypothetical protein [Virgibacillus soli]MDY0409675.1 hypothetical protein [Virgibacillus soli]
MYKRFLMVFLSLIIAVVAALLVARYPTGPNTISYDEPIGLWLSIGMIIVLFLPPLILSLLRNRVASIISAVYQAFVVISFLGMIPVGLLFPEHAVVSVVALVGAIVTISSVVLAVKTNSNKEMKY